MIQDYRKDVAFQAPVFPLLLALFLLASGIDAIIGHSTTLALSSPPFGNARDGAASPCQATPL